MNKHKVVCIILNYNDRKRTLALTKTIVEYDAFAYVIVVDNCSPDDSYERLAGFEHEKYVLIKSPVNGGYGSGNNIGIKKAKELGAEFAVISNPDVEFSEECVIRLLQTFEKHPDCAIAGGIETTGEKIAWKRLGTLCQLCRNEFLLDKLVENRYLYPQDHFKNKEYVQVDIIPGCFFMVDTERFLKYGMYDENNFLYYEEEILERKFCDTGYKFIINTAAKYKHLHKDSLKPGSIWRTKKNMINAALYYLENYRGVKGAKLFLCRLFLQATRAETLARALFYGIVRRDKV